MFGQAAFNQWLRTIMQHRPHLSKPQATVLALWSFGMVLARACALSAVSHLLAKGMQRQEQTVRQQLRAWYDDITRKRGAKRQAPHVETYFPLSFPKPEPVAVLDIACSCPHPWMPVR